MFVANHTREGRGVVTFDPPRDFRSRLVRTMRRKTLARDIDRYPKSGLDAGELFSRKEAIEQALNAQNFVELVAALNAPVS